MRAITIPAIEIIEDITTLAHAASRKEVHLSVESGSVIDGVFKPKDVGQQEHYRIHSVLYNDLITKFPTFTKSDLWLYVDALRNGANTAAISMNYSWNFTTSVWEEDIDKARAEKFKAILTQRGALDAEDIVYDGKTLQADSPSKALLQGKIMEVQSALALGLPTANLVWRDSGNVTHVWGTPELYLAWLQGFGVAIAERSSQLYINSWVKKSDVEALTLFADIESYSV